MTLAGNIKHISHPALLSPWSSGLGPVWWDMDSLVPWSGDCMFTSKMRDTQKTTVPLTKQVFCPWKKLGFLLGRWWRWFISFLGGFRPVFGGAKVLDDSNSFQSPNAGSHHPIIHLSGAELFQKPTRRRCQHASATRNGCDVGDIHSWGFINLFGSEVWRMKSE